jgi:hypothetical protein
MINKRGSPQHRPFDAGSGQDALFPNDEGNPDEEIRLRKVSRRALASTKLHAFRLYNLCHAFALRRRSILASLLRSRVVDLRLRTWTY